MHRRFIHGLAICILVFLNAACSSNRPRPATDATLRCLQPRPVVTAPRYTWGTSGGAWVARYEPGATRPSWRRPLAVGVNASISSVATLSESEIAVVGTASRPAAGGEFHPERRTGFVQRLSARDGEALGLSFATGPVATEFHDAAPLPDGRVLVTGIGDAPLPTGIPVLPRIRQVEPEGANAADARPLFLAVYTSDLTQEIGRMRLGATIVRRPRVWLDCQGTPVVGTTALVNGQCSGSWPDLVYQQGRFAENYDVDHDWNQQQTLGYPPGGWGFHALRWKSYHAGPSYSLAWAPVGNSPQVPRSSIPSCPDAQTLNTLEGTLFTPSDPGGGWNCGQHTTMSQLSLISAFLFSRWTTPVYTHVKRSSGGPFVPDSVAVERVVFRPVCPLNPNAYSGQKLEDLCDFTVDDVANVNCQALDMVGGVAGNGFVLRFDRFEGTRWFNGGTVWYTRPMTYLAATGPYTWQQWYEPGAYIFDPPENSEREQAIVLEAARQLAGAVVRPQRVVITTVEAGRITGSSRVDALIPATE